MLVALNIAASGMHAAELRLQAAAANIANVDTPNYAPRHVDQSSLPGGGVEASIVSKEVGSGVDPVREFANILSANLEFAANAMVISVSSKMAEALYEAVSHDRRPDRR